MNWNRLLFIKIQSLPLSMHKKFKEFFYFVCKTTNVKLIGNQLRMKSVIHWKDISNMSNAKFWALLSFVWFGSIFAREEDEEPQVPLTLREMTAEDEKRLIKLEEEEQFKSSLHTKFLVR